MIRQNAVVHKGFFFRKIRLTTTILGFYCIRQIS